MMSALPAGCASRKESTASILGPMLPGLKCPSLVLNHRDTAAAHGDDDKAILYQGADGVQFHNFERDGGGDDTAPSPAGIFNDAPAMPRHIAPARNPTTRHRGMVAQPGQCGRDSATTVAATAPATNCPSPPMLITPPRKAMRFPGPQTGGESL